MFFLQLYHYLYKYIDFYILLNIKMYKNKVILYINIYKFNFDKIEIAI